MPRNTSPGIGDRLAQMSLAIAVGCVPAGAAARVVPWLGPVAAPSFAVSRADDRLHRLADGLARLFDAQLPLSGPQGHVYEGASGAVRVGSNAPMIVVQVRLPEGVTGLDGIDTSPCRVERIMEFLRAGAVIAHVFVAFDGVTVLGENEFAEADCDEL